jgi:2-polyprenyl-3-methyl-5-hydroxy-6-metoxy-1,4-benzoquinol methylase
LEVNLKLKFIDVKENKIDPNRLRNKNFFKGIFKDRKKNFNNLSDLIIRTKIKECQLCKSKKIENNFLKITTSYYLNKCHNCFLVFPNTNFKSNKNYTDRVYSKYSEQNHRRSIYKTQKYRKHTFIKDRFDYCVKRLFKSFRKINILEYGCGFGLFLNELKKYKIKNKGLEIDRHQIDIAKKRGLNVSNNNIKDEKNNFYDLCVMFDVLEHLTNPINELKIINKKIKKGGYLICYSPNIYSAGFELMGKNQNQVYPFEHLFFFSKKSLEILAKKTGFKITKFETFGLDMVDYFLYKEFKDKKKYTYKLKKLINLIQPIIDKSQYGNHFRVTFKKI